MFNFLPLINNYVTIGSMLLVLGKLAIISKIRPIFYLGCILQK